MVRPTTLTALAGLEQEMADTGRSREQGALHEALQALGRSDHDFLTTGQAAERLSVSIPTVKRWGDRGALAALDDEGNPTPVELQLLRRRNRGPSLGRDGAASGA